MNTPMICVILKIEGHYANRNVNDECVPCPSRESLVWKLLTPAAVLLCIFLFLFAIIVVAKKTEAVRTWEDYFERVIFSCILYT